MALPRESLPVLLDRVYANYLRRLAPLDQPARTNLVRVLASVEAGLYHQLLGDMAFLADQIFPDTATGDYLRLHWSDRVPPLYAVPAVGYIRVRGVPTTPVPAGIVFRSRSGRRYFTSQAYLVSPDGSALVWVQAAEPGVASNLEANAELSISSAIPVGLESTATVLDGIRGGVDEESDEAYLSRVLLSLRNATRYGKPGDFAAWARDASPDVSSAFEFRNFGVFGALLIQVISGNQFSGVSTVGNLQVITSYIDSLAPPIIYTVRTPSLRAIAITVGMRQSEMTDENQGLALARLKTYLNASARPGIRYSQGQFRDAIVDGVAIRYARVTINNGTAGEFPTTILEYPVLGEVTFAID